nr:unnamed protein product [Callosobruchus analis]
MVSYCAQMFNLFFRSYRNTLIFLTLVYLAIQVALYLKIFKNDSFTPVLLWWTPFMLKHDRIIDCGEEHYQCISSNNRDHITDVNLDLTYYVPLKNSGADTSPVLYVQSDCDTPIDRDKIVKELGKYVKIDSYGACLNNKTFPQSLQNIDPLDLYNRGYMTFISKYKFIVSIENAACYDYVTEKLWRPLIVGSIPIYLGAPNIRDWLPNVRSAILLDDFENIEEVGKYINQIDNNDELYYEFLQHKTSQKYDNNFLKHFTMVEHPITDFECYVCSTLHKKETPAPVKGNVYDCPAELNRGGTWDQHWSIGKCQAKALHEFLRQNIPYTAEDLKKSGSSFFGNKTDNNSANPVLRLYLKLMLRMYSIPCTDM